MSPASQQDYAYNPKPLLVGDMPVASIKGTLVTPENRTRGAVLGRIAGAASAAPWATNTGGSGTIGAVTVGAGVKEGVYRVVCVEPAANLGTFAVEDPDGNIIGRAIVGTPFVGPVNFTISDATDFVSGDGFDITVAVGTTYKLSAAAATDGSHIPRAILAEDADATAGNVECLLYVRGDFAENALTLGAGHTLASIREGLRARGITLISQAL